MGLNPHDMGSLFKAAKSLAEGLRQRRTAPPRSGAVLREKIKSHFQDIWTINREGIDLSVVDQVEQRPMRQDLDCAPGIEEVAVALAAAKNGVATADSSLPAEFCKLSQSLDRQPANGGKEHRGRQKREAGADKHGTYHRIRCQTRSLLRRSLFLHRGPVLAWKWR